MILRAFPLLIAAGVAFIACQFLGLVAADLAALIVGGR